VLKRAPALQAILERMPITIEAGEPTSMLALAGKGPLAGRALDIRFLRVNR